MMSSPSTVSVTQAIERFLLRSTPASRCLLITTATAPCFLLYLGLHAYGLGQADIRAGLNLNLMAWLQGALAVAVLCLAGLSLWLWPRRKDPRERPVLEIVISQIVGGIYTFVMILAGGLTAGPILILMGILAIGLILLQRRTMLLAFATSACAMVLYDLAVQWHGVPYAPAIKAQAFHDGQAVWWWASWRSLLLYGGGAIVVGLILGLFESLDNLHDHLVRLSVTDGLTGLANRRSFMTRLQAELARQKRTGQPLALALIDADHFKQINDEHGHQMGDEVLKKLASILGLGVRAPTDLAARLGGEEFALLMPASSSEDALAVCSRIQRALSQYRFGGDGRPQALTVSIGVAQADPGADLSAEALLKAADEGLYDAKRAGRNRVVQARAGADLAPQGGR